MYTMNETASMGTACRESVLDREKSIKEINSFSVSNNEL